MICPGCGKQCRTAHPKCLSRAQGRTAALAREGPKPLVAHPVAIGIGDQLQMKVGLGANLSQAQRDAILRGVNTTPRRSR